MIANGRISDRSFRRYRWVRGLMRRVLADVSVFAMQTDEDARRIIALGAPPSRVVVTGNLKSDLLPEAAGDDPAGWRARLHLGAGARLWIAGSTHRGEEAVVLDAFLRARSRCPELALLLAPRHPERAGEVEALIRERGLLAARRSRLPADGTPGAVMILDTVGELAALYALAEIVFVGGSLVPIGGHNVLEPAMRGKPVLVGPHMSNFREGAELLQRSGGGLVVKDAPELERELARLLEDRDLARRMGDAAREAFAGRQGAVSATLDLVGLHLWPRAEGAAS
jgi:3-deoxy-D-manno-octulosonic-acid transferase